MRTFARSPRTGWSGAANGFTLIELMIVMAVIGILAAISMATYHTLHQSARVAKAQADMRAIATAASQYLAHTGSIAPNISALTIVAGGSFSVTATGDGTTVVVP